jgi:hypothetical protein
MRITYTLSRTENVRSFLGGIVSSPRIGVPVFFFCVLAGAASLATRAQTVPPLTLQNVARLLGWAFGAFCFLIVWLFLRAKTTERSLTTSEVGISTQIGRLKGEVPWSKIGVVRDTGRFVLLAGRTGNAFFIPARAFENSEAKELFLAEIDQWRGRTYYDHA